MKTLLILRHGKTQPDAPRGDHARALTERGRRDSATMGAYILQHSGTPDAVYASDATRARQTAEIAAPAAGFTGDITIEPRIYGADLPTLLTVVTELNDDAATALLIGHNPGFEELTAALAGIDPDEVRLPTAGLARLVFGEDTWSRVFGGSGNLLGVMTPKMLAESREGGE